MATVPAGYKLKSGVANTKCTGSASSCLAPVSTCFEKDVLKCGGLSSPTCASGKYKGYSTAWQNTAATDANKNTNCCVDVATCSMATVPAGYKLKSGVATTKCTGSASTCLQALCFEKDVLKCGGLTSITCASGKYKGYSTAWKNTAATDANKNVSCCADKATCSSATVSSGYKMKDNVASTLCSSDAASCATSTCIELDVLKCGGLASIGCASLFYNEKLLWVASTTQATKDTWNNRAATNANKNTNCCTLAGTCAAFSAYGTSGGSQRLQLGASIFLAVSAGMWVT